MTTVEFERLGPSVGRANSAIFITTAILGFLTWFAISTGTWLLLFVLDNFLKLPAALRFPLSIAAAVLTAWTFWKYVICSMRKRRTDEQVALMLERKYGINENVLINTIQFEGMRYGEHQKDFILETAKAGSLGLKAIPLRDLWQFGRMSVWWGIFALLFSLWAIYILTMPGFADNAFFRYANSLSDVPPLGSVTLDVTPNQDVQIAEREDIEITLKVGDLSKDEELTTYPELFHKEGIRVMGTHRGDGTEAKMEPIVGKPNTYRYTFEDVRRSFAFRIFVRDTYTRSIKVTVNPAPKIIESSFFVTPPAYTALSTRQQPGPPHPLKCLPKSKLGIEIKVDKPVEWLKWLPPEGKVDFDKTGDLTWKTATNITAAGAYDVEAKGMDLARSLRVATGTIMLKTDRRPQVRFVDAAMSRIVTPGDHFPLRIEAKDDYGVAELQLTVRPAYGGSEHKIIREWKFGDPPGQRGKAEKRFELAVDASIFVPGRKYFLEGRAGDFCPETSWGISEPILLTVKTIEALRAAEGSGLNKLYDALERAIRLQKQALDNTRNLSSNMNNVWTNMSGELRTADEVQKILNRYRTRILEKQLGVRTALLQGVQGAPSEKERLAARMKEIAEAEAVEANDRSFAACRRPHSAGELKPAVEGAFPLGQDKHAVHFKARQARYFGLMVISPHKWTDETWISRLSMLDKDAKPLDTSGWRVVSSRGGGNPKKALDKEGWPAKGRLPHILVVDMGAERSVSGIVCRAQNGQVPKDFKLYVSAKDAPEIVSDAPDKTGIAEELKLLQRVQESIYNQLLALKGKEAEETTKKNEEKTKKALGEEGLEQAPTVAEKLEDFRDKLKAWTQKHDENTKKRKAVMGIPPEDFTDEDKRKLEELNLEKRKLARKFGELVEDLARLPWDFADDQQVKIFKELRQQAEEMKDLVDLAAEEAGQGAFSWNLDTMISREGKEINVPTLMEAMGAGNEPGQSEASEDKARPLKIGELPTELPLRIPKLKAGLEAMQEPPMSGSSMMDHSSPTGGPMGDNLDSASADGQMTNRTPNPRNKTKGRGNLGRSGQADGQMVAEKAPAIPDDQTAMPNRMTNAPSEPGSVAEEGNQPATAIGLGKGTGKPVDFAKQGKLPPDELRKMREFAGEANEIRENCRNLMLALDRYNLPTTDLKKALLRLEQIQMATKGGQGVEIRRAINAAIKHVDAAGGAVARAIELRRKEEAEYRKKRRFASDTSADTVPDGYKDIVNTYFRRLAEESAKSDSP
jgi:hypothetical protein